MFFGFFEREVMQRPFKKDLTAGGFAFQQAVAKPCDRVVADDERHVLPNGRNVAAQNIGLKIGGAERRAVRVGIGAVELDRSVCVLNQDVLEFQRETFNSIPNHSALKVVQIEGSRREHAREGDRSVLGVKNGCAHAVFHRDVSAEVDESGKPLRVVFSGSAEGAEVVKREFAVVVLGFVGQTLPIQINIGERAREFAFGDEIFKGLRKRQ